MKKLLIAGLAIAAFSATSALAEDVAAGKKVFKKCSACHTADKAKNKVGPHLINVVDRAAGSIEGYKYSKALVAKVEEESLVWTEENIAEYLKKPKTFIKGTKMSFAGLKKEKDITNVIAYLKSKTGEE